ncbi:MAG: Na+/H+ antiporter NhaC family protein [Bacteroidota bacterium]
MSKATFYLPVIRYSILRVLLFSLILFPSILPAQDSTAVGDSLEVLGPPEVPAFSEQNLSFSYPKILRVGNSYPIEVVVSESLSYLPEIALEIDGTPQTIQLAGGKGSFSYTPQEGASTLSIGAGEEYETKLDLNVVKFPPWLAILPPLFAIVLALIFKEVIVSLFLGILMGAAVLGFYAKGTVAGIFSGFLTTIDSYILSALTDSSHISVILFSLLIGGMVAIISRNGGMQGIVDKISGIAKTATSGQFATWLMGLVIFFDDYANTLVVGNTMRSITDKLRISREKLAYLVDSTAAPVAALAFITTWIGAELGYIEDGTKLLSNFPEGQSAYGIFLNSLAYAFYPIMNLLFMLMIIFTGRDYGPMLRAEMRARQTGRVSKKVDTEDADESMKHFQPLAGITPKAYNALIPVIVLVGGVLIGLLYTGWSAETWADPESGFFSKLSKVIGDSDSYVALLWGSLSAVVVAALLTLSQRMMSLTRVMDTMVYGFKAMFGALVILVLAWALQKVTEDMHTAGFLTEMFGNQLAPALVPAITFLLGALVSFSTGSSWGTMAILYPLMIPLCWEVSLNAGLTPDAALPILYNTVACVLAGSVLGDHCSPISDTTILSSLACSCDHIDHVQTQLPYALTVGTVATLVGTIPSAYGFPSWLSIPIGLGLLFLVVRFLGSPVKIEKHV